ncbi:hypothetical protein D3C75_991090 [compost metagenome]
MAPARRPGNQRLTSPGIMPWTTATPSPATTALAISAQALSSCKRHRQANAMATRPPSMPPCSLIQRRSQGCNNGTRPMHSTGSAVSNAACWYPRPVLARMGSSSGPMLVRIGRRFNASSITSNRFKAALIAR